MITSFGSFFSSGLPKFNPAVVLLPCPLNPEIINTLEYILRDGYTALGKLIFYLFDRIK